MAGLSTAGRENLMRGSWGFVAVFPMASLLLPRGMAPSQSSPSGPTLGVNLGTDKVILLLLT